MSKSARYGTMEPMNRRFGEQLIDARDSPAAERNKEPIAAVLTRVLPAAGLVVEIASGTGQHAEHFARTFPALTWQPTDPDPELLAITAARVARAALGNLRAPLAFDVHAAAAPVDRADAVVCSNMIHIAPWSATPALLRHASALLASGAPLVLYGPYKRGGEHTAPSNAAFDANLRSRNADWGVRDLDDVAALAQEHGFELDQVVAMPANNFTVIFRRTAH
jgi:SAM-dependent methyltransferase